ncbi:MAG TPA: hypothetical protein VD971_13885 [Phycisphaerales bacterium]|nr:hypothetical protein [Phycisphaerales bacterium]
MGLGLILSVLAAVAGVAGWGYLAYATGLSAGWAVIVLGAAAGSAMSWGARKEATVLTGLFAATITLVATALGLFVVSHTRVAGEVARLNAGGFEEGEVYAWVEQDMRDRWTAAGRDLSRVPDAAAQRWEIMTPGQREKFGREHAQDLARAMDADRGGHAWKALTGGLGLLDALWAIAGMGAAAVTGAQKRAERASGPIRTAIDEDLDSMPGWMRRARADQSNTPAPARAAEAQEADAMRRAA